MCLLVVSSAIIFGLIKWLPTILILNYFIGNAMYVVAKVQITSAQCTGLGIAEGLLLIYISLGRSWVRAVFLFPQHRVKSETQRLMRGITYKLSLDRLLDFAWGVGMAVPGFDLIGLHRPDKKSSDNNNNYNYNGKTSSVNSVAGRCKGWDSDQ